MPQPAPRLSVVMITLNEERLIGTVLESVAWADEIVIVDSGSTDRTEEIARRYTSRFYTRPYEGQGRMRKQSLELATGSWILYIDADEVVSPSLRQSIETAIGNPAAASAFSMELHTYFMGKWFGTRGWRREWKTRLFRRDRGHFDDKIVHEGAVVNDPVERLEGVILHYPYRDVRHAVEKMNRYSTQGAPALEGRGRRRSWGAVALVKGGVRFLRDYIAGGDFLYGNAGLVRSSIMAYYTLLKYVKAGEAQHASRPTTK